MPTVFQRLCRKYELNGAYYSHRDEEWQEGVLYEVDGNSPCYLYGADAGTHSAMTDAEVLQYLRACARATIGVVILSFTEEEPHWKQWLRLCKSFNGCTVTPGRSVNHGGYKVWLVSITGTKKGNSDD